MTCTDFERHERLLLGCTHPLGPQVHLKFNDGCGGRVCEPCAEASGALHQPDLFEKIAGPPAGLDMLEMLRAVRDD